MANNNETIIDHVQSCVFQFNECLSEPDQETIDLAREQQVRFNLWAANIGVFAGSHASLDFRLREHPDVRAMVLRALRVLQRNLKRAIEVSIDPPTEILRAEKRHSIDRNPSSSSSSGSESSSLSKPSQTGSTTYTVFVPASEVFLKAAKRTVDQLQRISIAIRKSSVLSRNSRASSFIDRDEDGNDVSSRFRSYAVCLVKARHGNASVALCERLGASMCLRRRRFLYQQRHQRKLAGQYHAPTLTTPQQTSWVQQRTQATVSHEQKGIVIHDTLPFRPPTVRSAQLSNTEASIFDPVRFHRPPPSSGPSIISSRSLDYPPPPLLKSGRKECECPYCFNILGANDLATEGAWRRHVNSDLEYLVCVFDECDQPVQLYRNSEDWLSHMREHTLQWRCSAAGHSKLLFTSKQAFEDHMKQEHPHSFTEAQLSIIAESNARPSSDLFNSCPFCNSIPDDIAKSIEQNAGNVGNRLQKHIEIHLVSLALLSLPWQDYDGIKESVRSNDASLGKHSESNTEESFPGSEKIRQNISLDGPLTFEDPPHRQRLNNDFANNEDFPTNYNYGYEEDDAASWDFLPSMPYSGHLEDPTLATFALRASSTPAPSQCSLTSPTPDANTQRVVTGLIPASAPFATTLEESVRKIQEISKTELCAVHIGIKKDRYFSTFQLRDSGRVDCIATVDDGRIFAGSSLFEVFIAAGVSLMIEKLSAGSDPANRFRGLRNAWARTFTDVFNEFSQDFQIEPLYGNPTVFELIVHYKGPRNINHLLLAPDGSPLLSKNAFLHTISQYTEDTRKQHNNNTAWCEYSNGNYILIALLIEIVSEKSLPEFLREYIFEPLGMHRTYMSAKELSSVPIEQRVQPHIVSGNGIRRAIHFNEIPYLSDTVEIAAMGGYTCAADIGKFFEMVLDGLYGTPSSAMFDEDFVRSLFKGIGALDKDTYGYTRFGLFTTLNENLPGSHSLNRLISSGNDSSTYTLGKDSQNREVKAYYIAGSATGWLNTVYLLPKQQIFIIVLTNTSGPLDISDIISRLYLQEILDLRPSKIRDPNFTCRPKGWRTMTPPEIYRAHYVELAARIYQENARVYRQLEKDDNAADTPTAGCRNALGIYKNGKFGLYLEVIDLDGTLGVRLKGESKVSKPMRFIRKGQLFRICSRSRHITDLAINCFGDWQNLEFSFEEENGIIMCFFRRGLYLVDRFTRTLE